MEFVSIEARPRLCSCNVYICMRCDTQLNNVEVTLLEESIILSIEGVSTTLILPNIKIIPTSLSALNINNNWISFHTQTKPVVPSFGSIKTELVINGMSEKCRKKPTNTNPPLVKNMEYEILCRCCKNIVTKATSFKRIFPFPDIDYDPSEWFCCKAHAVGNDVLELLHPQEQDYYYGLFFSILNKNIFGNGVRIDKDILLCSRCMYDLGKLHLKHSFKIWNCSVDFKSFNNELLTKTASDPLTDFIGIIKNSGNTIVGEEIVLKAFVGKEVHYLIIKPMMCELCLITEPEKIVNSIKVQLEQRQVIKTLYKYANDNYIVCDNGINVSYYDVSFSIIEAAFTYLLSSSKRIPQPYRSTGDYYVGHIDSDVLTN